MGGMVAGLKRRYISVNSLSKSWQNCLAIVDKTLFFRSRSPSLTCPSQWYCNTTSSGSNASSASASDNIHNCLCVGLRFIVSALDLPPDSPMAVLWPSNVAHHSTVNKVEIAVIPPGRKFNILYKKTKNPSLAMVISGPFSHSGDIVSRRPQEF